MWAWVIWAGVVGASQTPTFHEDVSPILSRRCTSCHQSGGLGGFDLQTYDDALAWRDQIKDAVLSDRMPPWLPDESCRPLQRSRALTDEELSILTAWVDAGGPEGSPMAATPVEPEPLPTLPEPVMTLGGRDAYLPNAVVSDDYRCMVLDAEFLETTYVTGYDFHPGQSQLVHHAALFLALPAWFDQLAELEAGSSEQVGYPCFGGPGIDFVEYFGGWVPGSGAVQFPEDSAFVIPAGAKVIMQVHYNMAAGFTAPDRTTVSLSTVSSPPTMRLKQRPMVNLDFLIAKDDPRSVQVSQTPHTGSGPWTGVGVLPHMHLLGEEIKLEVLHPDGGRTCLVDIPAWDFEWQETYFFQDPVTVNAGDTIELTCVFHNSADNQPLVDGIQQASSDVRWGEGTRDEMCVVVLTTLAPMDAETSGACVVGGDEGNEFGVGRFCTDLGGECDGLDANFCLASAVEEMPFCTKIFCASDDECGSGATCEGGVGGSACIPLICQGDGERGCSCDASRSPGSSPWGGVLTTFMLLSVAFRQRRR